MMKALIISDSHRKNANILKVLNKLGPIDIVIHLGDAEGSEEGFLNELNCPLFIVAGNNDFFSELEYEKEFNLEKYKIFICHGNQYAVTVGYERLIEEARQREVDIVMCGHTHRPKIEKMEDLLVLNPGSISYPRQENRKPSFILLEIDKNGELHYTLNYIDNDEICR